LTVRKKVASRQKKQFYASKLASHKKRLNTIRFRRELLEVVTFEVLNHGCKHACAKWFLSTRKADPHPCGWVHKHCVDKCRICSGDWSNTFLRVRKESVVRFLESHHFSKEMPLIARGDNVVDV
jgi:hypothetical protein